MVRGHGVCDQDLSVDSEAIMIEAAQSSAAAGLATQGLQVTSPAASTYAAYWDAPLVVMQARPAVPVAVAGAGGSSIPSSTARAKESALLAADVYRDTPVPPAGFRVADAQDLAKLNLKPGFLEQPGSSFRARVYVTGTGADARYVVAFRGSASGEDWKNNFQQAAGTNSESYAKALTIGVRLAHSGESVTICGHSLGGGLAAEAAIASGREADTFNAAGLSAGTIATAKADNRAGGGRGGDVAVQAYNVPGEILTFLQDGGDRVLGGLLLGAPGALLADAPSAYGSRHLLPDAVPDGKSWFQAHSRIDRHMIDWVLAGANALR